MEMENIKFKSVKKSVRENHKYWDYTLRGLYFDSVFTGAKETAIKSYNANDEEILKYVKGDIRFLYSVVPEDRHLVAHLMYEKMLVFQTVAEYFRDTGKKFDIYNGGVPTEKHLYMAYEFGAIYLWGILVQLLKKNDYAIKFEQDPKFYDNFKDLISKVYQKYPATTSDLLFDLNMSYPNNRFDEFTNMDDANFDSDTQEGWNNEKADKFYEWFQEWCRSATEHDRLRVKNWFEKEKSHKQIFSEIQKVVGNPSKFNSRLALFLERLLNNENCEKFFSKSGFASKKDMFMEYLKFVDVFDDEARESFINKYLVKGE